MAWPPEKHIQTVIAQAEQVLTEVRIIRHNVNSSRALIDLEGIWQSYRIVVSEIHRPDGTRRYTYYVLDKDNQHIHRFDNTGDKKAIELRYGADWKAHQYEEIPHQHDMKGDVTLTPIPMTFEMFIEWLSDNLKE